MQKQLFLFLLFFTLAFWVSHNNQKTEYGSHDRHFEEYQEGVISHTIQGPLAYRVLMPYTIELLGSIEDSITGKLWALYLNILLILVTQFAFFHYLKNFLSESYSLAGVLWLDLCIMMGFTSFMGVHVYESTDVCNLLFMSLSLHLLYRRNWIWLTVTLFISMFNRETPALLLIPVFMLWRKEKFPAKYLATCIIAVAIPYLGLKMIIHPPQPSWFLTIFLNENIPFLETGKLKAVFYGYLKFFLFLGPALYFSLTRLKEKNNFLNTILAIVPVFIAIHLVVGHVEEYRVWMPLMLVLIPLSLESVKNIFKPTKEPV